MTTSYELSLRLKELGVEQDGGTYYWCDMTGEKVFYHRLLCPVGFKLCRAFTLGELVRELGDGFSLFGTKGGYRAWLSTEWHELFNTSPEEAAGELLAELKQKEVSNV